MTLCNHLANDIKSILNEYFDKDEKVKYASSPFPLDSKFKYELYSALTMTDKKLVKQKYNIKVNSIIGQEHCNM